MTTTINASTSGSGGLVQTADASGVLALQTAGVTAATVDASQNVGIGTVSPTNKLHVSSSSFETIKLQGTSTVSGINFVNSASSNGYIYYDNGPNMLFYINGSERMRIDSSGNVGIGTSSPLNFGGANLQVQNSTIASIVWSDGTYIGQLLASASAEVTIGSRSNHPLRLSTNDTERMRIDTSGNLLLGTTSSTIGGDSGRFLIEAGGGLALLANRTGDGNIFRFYRSSSQVGSINVTSSATAYNTSSDYRLKNSIAPMTGALAKVALLKPCTYKWNADGSDGQGFIAHELAEVVPNCVTGDKDAVETYTDEDGDEATRPAYQSIDTSFLVATLTAAIQEQQALITSLTARIAALEGTPA